MQAHKEPYKEEIMAHHKRLLRHFNKPIRDIKVYHDHIINIIETLYREKGGNNGGGLPPTKQKWQREDTEGQKDLRGN